MARTSHKYDPFMAAIERAFRKGRETDQEWFVVYDRDLERYSLASQYDMDTYYLGINPADVLYSSVEGIIGTPPP